MSYCLLWFLWDMTLFGKILRIKRSYFHLKCEWVLFCVEASVAKKQQMLKCTTLTSHFLLPAPMEMDEYLQHAQMHRDALAQSGLNWLQAQTYVQSCY